MRFTRGLFIMGVMSFLFGCTPISGLKVPDTYDGCSGCSLIVRQMAVSLDTEAREWKTDGYHVWRGDASMWIANEAYGIGIGPSKREEAKLSNAEERALLWRAFQRWVTNQDRWR